MDQQIFALNLSLEGTSLYLLLAAFHDQGQRMRREQVLNFWNSTEAALNLAWRELQSHNIGFLDTDMCWIPHPASQWRPSLKQSNQPFNPL